MLNIGLGKVPMRLLSLFLFLLLYAVNVEAATASVFSLESPDGQITVEFRLAPAPTFSVAFRGQPLIGPSQLGLNLGGSELCGVFRLVKRTERRHDSTFQMPFGKSRNLRDRFRESVLRLRENDSPHRSLQIIFRIFNDGVAFRYRFPE